MKWKGLFEEGGRERGREEERGRDAVHQMSNLTAAAVTEAGADFEGRKRSLGRARPVKVHLRSIQFQTFNALMQVNWLNMIVALQDLYVVRKS